MNWFATSTGVGAFGSPLMSSTTAGVAPRTTATGIPDCNLVNAETFHRGDVNVE
jgi:hypothetical protein